MCRHDLKCYHILVNRYSGDPELNAHFYTELNFSLFINRKRFFILLLIKTKITKVRSVKNRLNPDELLSTVNSTATISPYRQD